MIPLLLGLILLIFFFVFIPWVKKKAITYVEEHSEYTLRINSIIFTGLYGLEITGLEIRPKLERDQFYKTIPIERDWISAKGQLSIEGINWKKLYQEKKIYANKVCLKEGDLYVFRDKRMRNGPYKYKPLHSTLLREASFLITVPMVEVINSRIEYEEHPLNGSPGKVVFSKLYGSLYNLSTDSAYITNHPVVILNGRGMILDSIKANMQYKFYVLKDTYTFEGHTGSFSATVFNKCIVPMAKAKVESGYVKRIDLFFQADNHQSTGTFDMDFSGLEIDFLDKKNSIIEWFVNKDDRKRNGKEKKAGEIDCVRDKGASVFNYWWGSIKSGMFSSIIKIKFPRKEKKK